MLKNKFNNRVKIYKIPPLLSIIVQYSNNNFKKKKIILKLHVKS